MLLTLNKEPICTCYLILGDKPIDTIKTRVLVDLLLAIQEKGVLDTVKKIKGIVTRVFIYAVSMEAIEYNPLVQYQLTYS